MKTWASEKSQHISLADGPNGRLLMFCRIFVCNNTEDTVLHIFS